MERNDWDRIEKILTEKEIISNVSLTSGDMYKYLGSLDNLISVISPELKKIGYTQSERKPTFVRFKKENKSLVIVENLGNFFGINFWIS